MKARIALIPGDGIGPEVVAQGKAALEAIARIFGHDFEFIELDAGGVAIDRHDEPLPAATLETAKLCDAILMGAVGGPAWDMRPGNSRPEKAILGLRAGLGLYANLRPARLLHQLKDACPLKDEVLRASSPDGSASFDLLIVRELTGGIYFGERGRFNSTNDAANPSAFDTEAYSTAEIERVLEAGYQAASIRRKRLCVVDKANVLETSRLWREVANRMAAEYPKIETSFMYVDNCAMQLVRAPGQFDVIVTSNLFGDILSDEASVLTGSIGMLPSASLGSPGEGPVMGLYEPIHGSAPDIAGKNLANPLGTILSAAMLLRHSLGLEREARALEAAVDMVLDSGLRTADIAPRQDTATSGSKPCVEICGTREMGAAVVTAIVAAATAATST